MSLKIIWKAHLTAFFMCLGLTAGLAYGHEATDAEFAQKAASGGMAEVKLGQLAQEKGSSATVKDFGKRMQADHSKAGEKLKDVASKDNISLPSDLDSKDQQTYNKLNAMSGAAFDKAYANDMVSDHENDIADFKKETAKGKNPDLRNFASRTLPTLEEHLKMAREMQQAVASGKTETSEK